MIRKSFISRLFNGFSIQRWNDKLRPLELIQMDKHAHKMIIAYCLAKFEEEKGTEFDWIDIIRGGIYELLKRIEISDIQSPVYKEISKNKELMQKLNIHVYNSLEKVISNPIIRDEIKNYLAEPDFIHPNSRRILDAAHKYSSYWEFQIIKNINPKGYQIEDIENELVTDLETFLDLEGISKLRKNHQVKNFIDLCGQMRYQIRWGHLPRVPQTSVLGHIMMVASMVYLLTMEIPNVCRKRIFNNFFGGIFHDLPEAVTRDIIKPIKESVSGMSEEIKKIEHKLVEAEIYPHIEKSWHNEIKYFTEDEFRSKVIVDDKQIFTTSDEINEKYNKNKYNPCDGELIAAADNFAAFMEAWSSIQYGIRSKELQDAMINIGKNYENKIIASIPIYELYEGFTEYK
jgi:putative hydrolases of HD superfamily